MTDEKTNAQLDMENFKDIFEKVDEIANRNDGTDICVLAKAIRQTAIMTAMNAEKIFPVDISDLSLEDGNIYDKN